MPVCVACLLCDTVTRLAANAMFHFSFRTLHKSTAATISKEEIGLCVYEMRHFDSSAFSASVLFLFFIFNFVSKIGLCAKEGRNVALARSVAVEASKVG